MTMIVQKNGLFFEVPHLDRNLGAHIWPQLKINYSNSIAQSVKIFAE